ncbi:hypothetical protein V1512DRAFT_259787 [Lipomyces arxii]|uniref:uncharacterized protein n=1 Tax=Lipomyces arxii TaxID=56418 RepID=UPI0034CFBB84
MLALGPKSPDPLLPQQSTPPTSSSQSSDPSQLQSLQSVQAVTTATTQSVQSSDHIASFTLSSLDFGHSAPTPESEEPRQSVHVHLSQSSSPTLSALSPISSLLLCSSPPVYGIRAADLASAMDQMAYSPLPPPHSVFPWLHGLHPDNDLQLAFLDPKKQAQSPATFRNITLVKLGSLAACKLKGTVPHKDFLPDMASNQPGFLNLDPPKGVGLRNFHIQVAKIATLSDIVVYSKKGLPTDRLLGLAQRISQAQIYHRSINTNFPVYNTYIVLDPFEVFEQNYPDLVGISSTGKCYDHARDFLYHERREMTAMSAATQVTEKMYFGNLADTADESDVAQFDVYVECISQASIPTLDYMRTIDQSMAVGPHPVSAHLDFPSSGSLMLGNLTDSDLDLIVLFCEWLHKHTHENNHRVLLFCLDGYTETSMLGLAYLMYTTGVSAPQAYIDLHKKYDRAFFTFPADLVLLNHLQPRLLQRSPTAVTIAREPIPDWFMLMDGSLPSKIFPHVYLGNLGHANNPELLRHLGIKRVLSVGEVIDWHQYDRDKEWFTRLMYVDQVQDDGIDSLSRSIEDCLEFLDEGFRVHEPTLVHCRVGVSRSATVCIAEAMRREGMSLPRAYLFVRARRLNVIIQPNLRFMYELMKWEEDESARRGVVRHRRDMEWAVLCREIAAMNKAYIPT